MKLRAFQEARAVTKGVAVMSTDSLSRVLETFSVVELDTVLTNRAYDAWI